ncbi:MAG: organic solvent tolerance protein OstA [Bradyrhizobiaceae bacterium]|nr:organic solvent tolerance protein OstA [Bradyrhizobiaceae bacterium]
MAAIAAASAAGVAGAAAQGTPAAKGGSANLPSAFQGFSRDRDEPVHIEANSLEIIDKDRYAVFSGNVVVKQGDSTMRARELKVHYEGSLRESGKSAAAPTPPAGQQPARNDPAQRIRRLEALGGVIITNKDQKATGDAGVFDMRTNTATITGNVVLSQGPNIMRGDRLVVDLQTGHSKLEAGAKGGSQRVQGLFVPSSIDQKKSGSQK